MAHLFLLITATLTIVNTSHSHNQPVHNCVHGEIYKAQELRETKVKYEDHPHDQTMDNEHNKRRLLSPATTAPIRISAYYDPFTISSTYISAANIDYIKSLMSSTIRYYTQFVSVVPVADTFYVPRHCAHFYYTAWDTVINCDDYETPFVCGQVTIPTDHYGEDYLYFPATNTTAIKLPTGKGVLDTDLLLYVSYGDYWCSSQRTLAWAATCMQDQYGRPVAGTVNICPYMFDKANYWKRDLITLVHEVAHVLVMSPLLWSSFRAVNGDLIAESQVVDATDPMGDGLLYIISPTVKQLARDHFNCPTLPGLPLENTGGAGSAGSHWDEKYLQSATMSASLWSAVTYFTHFTVALMADSGWYAVDYNYTEPFYWGKNAGCQLWIDQCVDSSTFLSNFNQFYCHGVEDHGCSYDYVAPSECLIGGHNASLPAQFQYFSDSKFGGTEAADFCPFRIPQTTNGDYESVCWDVRGNTFTSDTYPPSQNYAVNSRCVDIIDASNQIVEYGYCFEHQCFGYDALNQQWDVISIKISSTENVTCTRAQQPGYKTVSTTSAASIGANVSCPDIDAICGVSSQPFACYWGNYNDQQQKCICSPGYIGTDCNTEDTAIEPEAESSLTKEPTPSPTMPLSTTLCLENFSQLSWLNAEYSYDGVWNFYPSWLRSGPIYVFWNIFQHKWLISDMKDTHSYWAFCNVSAWTADIQSCDGHWFVYRSAQNDNFLEINSRAYMGLCGFPVTAAPTPSPITTSPTTSPSNYPTTSPSLNPTKLPTLNPNTRAPTVTNYTYSPTIIPSTNPTNNPSTTPTKSPTENPTAIPTKSPTTDPTKNPSTSPTNAPSKPIFFRDFSIEFEYINQTIDCNLTSFTTAIYFYTQNYVNNNIIFEIDNLNVTNNMNASLLRINYQISSNASDEMLDAVENTINAARFKQLLMDDLEESYADCVDFKYIGFETSRSEISTSQLLSTDNAGGEDQDVSIKLLDWQNYNTTELLVVIGIGVVAVILICTMLYCLIRYCCNDRENASQFTHSNNAQSVVEFGGFHSKPRQKKAVFNYSNQFTDANHQNMQNRIVSDDTRWIEI